MKKLNIIALLLILLSFTANAQINFGPRIGISSSKVKIDKKTVTDPQTNITKQYETGDATFGFHAGAFVRVKILSLYLQPEVLFTSNGGEIKVTDANSTTTELQEYKFNKIDFPVMLGYKKSIFRFQAGPIASLVLKADLKEGSTTSDVKENYKNATIGFQAGFGLDISKLIIDLKYEGSLSKLGDEVSIPGSTQTFKTDTRGSQWVLTLGYKIF